MRSGKKEQVKFFAEWKGGESEISAHQRRFASRGAAISEYHHRSDSTNALPEYVLS